MMAPTPPPLDAEERAVNDYLEAMRAARSGTPAANFSEIESGFIAVAHAFAKRVGIEYEAWRDVGVDAETLRDAGIGPRT